ncbi:DeoR/GlpR family DNA-binding transcription regulator [Modestobacter marinus]|uniref:DeoR/GlpR family DNA-binding transcription regulator n=1 Tax=Modestobacter marinus TaxID=477641 RepID=UPI001C983AC5|nr:DeoR/GlpR family DNA-binding transcription regulator [Modestobacter marinus]
MYAEERQQAITGLVSQRGRVAVTAVAEHFGVTTETVRRDLATLERAGMLRRVHGGAVPVGALTVVESAFGERRGTRTEAKRRIAKAALALLPGPHGSVVLDGGSTTAALAELLPGDRSLTVATNSVPIAARLAPSPGISLHLLGGRVRGITQAAVGLSTVAALADLRADVVFIGTNGISATHGFSTPDEAEAGVKRAMASAGQRVVVLGDSSKIGREHLVRFAAVEDVDVLVTDDEADPAVVAELEQQGIEVLVG